MKTEINIRTFTPLTNGIAQRASIFIAALFCWLLLNSTANAVAIVESTYMVTQGTARSPDK